MAAKQSLENHGSEFERDLLRFLPSDMFVVEHQPPPPPPSYRNHRHRPPFFGRAAPSIDSYGLRAPHTSIQRRPPPPLPPRYPVPPTPDSQQRAVGRPGNRPIYPYPYPALTQVAPPFRYRAPPPRFFRGTGVYIPRPALPPATTDNGYGKQGDVQRRSAEDCLPEDWTY